MEYNYAEEEIYGKTVNHSNKLVVKILVREEKGNGKKITRDVWELDKMNKTHQATNSKRFTKPIWEKIQK